MTILKDRIKAKIDQSDDLKLLELIDDFFEDYQEPSIQLTQQEKDSLRISLNQLKNGNTISNEDVQNEIEEWLTK